jgi:hypothetical protein
MILDTGMTTFLSLLGLDTFSPGFDVGLKGVVQLLVVGDDFGFWMVIPNIDVGGSLWIPEIEFACTVGTIGDSM